MRMKPYATPAGYRAQAKVFKALGHPTRLFMAVELGRGERCVCELQELIGADMSTVSKHLSILREVGLVADERRGNQIFYSLAVPCVLNFMGCIDGLTGSRTRTTERERVTTPEDTA
jgi:DNA-binding transcriptional ArsR family regulator